MIFILLQLHANFIFGIQLLQLQDRLLAYCLLLASKN